MMTTNIKRSVLALLLATAGNMPASAQVEGQIQGQVELVAEAEVQATPPTQAVPPLTVKAGTLQLVSQIPSPYWIGVEGQPLDAAMRTALDLPEKHGILVARVTAESPAAKAGLQAGDILLQWCDAGKKCQPIESVEHLIQLVQDAAAKQPDQAITLEYRRRGKTETVDLKPAKRDEASQSIIAKAMTIGPNEHARHQQSALQQQLKNLERQRDEAKKKLEEAEAKTKSGKADKEAAANLAKAEIHLKLLDAQAKQAEAQLKQFELWTKAMSEHGFSIANPHTANFDVLIPAPGFVTKSGGQVHVRTQFKPVEWPEDLRVTMTRQGNNPAEFVIERGENKWQVTAETLQDLPPEVRPLIEPLAEPQKSRMLRLFQTQGNEAPGRVELRVPEEARPPQMALPSAPPRVVIHANSPLAPATQKQIDDLQKALEQLRKQVEQMEKK